MHQLGWAVGWGGAGTEREGWWVGPDAGCLTEVLDLILEDVRTNGGIGYW